jgi:hypothetical protein
MHYQQTGRRGHRQRSGSQIPPVGEDASKLPLCPPNAGPPKAGELLLLLLGRGAEDATASAKGRRRGAGGKSGRLLVAEDGGLGVAKAGACAAEGGGGLAEGAEGALEGVGRGGTSG